MLYKPKIDEKQPNHYSINKDISQTTKKMDKNKDFSINIKVTCDGNNPSSNTKDSNINRMDFSMCGDSKFELIPIQNNNKIQIVDTVNGAIAINDNKLVFILIPRKDIIELKDQGLLMKALKKIQYEDKS